MKGGVARGIIYFRLDACFHRYGHFFTCKRWDDFGLKLVVTPAARPQRLRSAAQCCQVGLFKANFVQMWPFGNVVGLEKIQLALRKNLALMWPFGKWLALGKKLLALRQKLAISSKKCGMLEPKLGKIGPSSRKLKKMAKILKFHFESQTKSLPTFFGM